MRPPANLANRLVRLPADSRRADALVAALRSAPGVADMLVMREESTVYLKVDEDRFDEELLGAAAAAPVAGEPVPDAAKA
jgi:hypothetical protein